MVKLKSEIVFGRTITFMRIMGKGTRPTVVKAFFKGKLVGKGPTKWRSIAKIKRKILEKLSK